MVYEHDGLQTVYTFMNEHHEQQLQDLIRQYGVDVIECVDVKENLHYLYTHNRVGEFLDQFESHSTEDYFRSFYEHLVDVDYVLDKINSCGMSALNEWDVRVLEGK
jgi:enoyl-[acyl-carrier-protein] reductase (NADH)